MWSVMDQVVWKCLIFIVSGAITSNYESKKEKDLNMKKKDLNMKDKCLINIVSINVQPLSLIFYRQKQISLQVNQDGAAYLFVHLSSDNF